MIHPCSRPFRLLVVAALAGCTTREGSPPLGTDPGGGASAAVLASPAAPGMEPPATDTAGAGAIASLPSPVTITTPYYSLSAPAARRADAETLARTLDGAIAALVADFAAADADRLLRSATVRVRVADAADERCGPGLASNQSHWNNGRCTAEIHVLAPSAHPDPASPDAPRTSVGEPMDEAYVQRVLVHEYATVLLESIARNKPRGWSFWNAPSWFVQGTQEYLGVMYSTDHARRVTLRKYTEATREQSLVTADWGFDARSPYVSGPVLVAFIHERFGREALVAVLRSERPTFGLAMREALATTPEGFHAAFVGWLGAMGPPDAGP